MLFDTKLERAEHVLNAPSVSNEQQYITDFFSTLSEMASCARDVPMFIPLAWINLNKWSSKLWFYHFIQEQTFVGQFCFCYCRVNSGLCQQ